MTVQHRSIEETMFQDMMGLSLDVGFFTSEFRLCDVIAEYLASIVAQSHEDPARYANFSSILVNEIAELAFRSARPIGKVDFSLLKNSVCVRICVGFMQEQDSRIKWTALDKPAASSPEHPSHDLITLASAVKVALHAEVNGDDRVTLIADILMLEGVH